MGVRLKMINLEKIRNAKGISYTIKAIPTIDGEYVKRLRKKLCMSQSLFACLMHVTKKTVEKWEQGVNPVTNGNAIAMVLFDNNPSLVNYFIETESEVYGSYRDAEVITYDGLFDILCKKPFKNDFSTNWKLDTCRVGK